MATVPVAPPAPVDRYGSSVASPAASGQLSNAQTGNGASTNIVDRGADRGPALLQIVSTIGATPTVTVLVEGSLDGTTWYPIGHAADDVAAPSVATFAITTATTTRRFLPTGRPWRFVRLTYSANTNVTLTADVLL